MGFKSKLKGLLEHLTGTHIYRILPRGFDVASDIAHALPMYHAQVIFDVGANVGQSAHVFRSNFPNSCIYCFEPVTNTYRQLQRNVRKYKHVHCYQLALGSTQKDGQMVLQGSSDMFFLLGQSREQSHKDVQTESVHVDTLDNFCHTNGINYISYLKIDTEGGDMDVLEGAVKMLVKQNIDIIQVETGMNPTNSRHVSFESVKQFLESYHYYLFGIYEQVNEWPTGKPHLRRTNPIFISQKLIEKK